MAQEPKAMVKELARLGSLSPYEHWLVRKNKVSSWRVCLMNIEDVIKV